MISKEQSSILYLLDLVDDAILLNEVINTLHAGSAIVICGGGATGISLAGAFSDTIGSKLRIKVVGLIIMFFLDGICA